MPDYSEHTIGSKNPVKRWIHRQRFGASIKLLQLKSHQHFLDYGCGDGELSLQIKSNYPNVKITAFDPAKELYEQAVKKLSAFPDVSVINSFNINSIGKFNRIACLETIEHLPEQELIRLFNNVKSVLKEDGLFLITFPIEHGVISIFKSCYRMLTGRDKYVSIGRAFRQFFGLHVPREQQKQLSDCYYIYSHVGFDSRKMIKKIQQNFTIEKITVLPMGFIACGMGNSVAVVCHN